MARISFTRFFTLFLVLSAALVTPHVNGAKRCLDILYKSGCNLEDCGAKCYKKHNSIHGGQCIANPTMTDYSCVCAYNCDG
ncbi:hypothetical protein POPTR_001G180750v4 [Populus trichocarpa]|uniref:Knottin scorpion toxin-like domain-containing protein n=1 Tax=Populus trichocarpa TaxID=3694 RepID=A0A3N7EI84_POPTR|nr:hypothetical protein POPTR_001G180750v4 [Populus trichocarpa]